MTVLWVFFAVAGVERGLLFIGLLVWHLISNQLINLPEALRCTVHDKLEKRAYVTVVRASGASALITRLNGEGKEYDSGTTELRKLVKRTFQTNNYF